MKRILPTSQALVIFLAAALISGCGSSSGLTGNPLSTAQNFGAGSLTAQERVLYSFTGGNDGGNAATPVTFDGTGNLYGTTAGGGKFTCGTVFKLAPKGGNAWKETVIHDFTCYGDGKDPHGGVTLNPHGNLDGTTVAGGGGGVCTGDGCGVVYQLTSVGENVLHDFTGGNDGFGPGGGVVFDSAGNLYGMTPDGGAHSDGTVYEVAPTGREHVLHAFTGGKDGGTGSLGNLLLRSGNLYGVTETGGAHGAGTVFEIALGAKKRLTTLYTFKGMPDAASPYGGLVADTSGNLYGTTYYGGANGVGSVFILSRGAHGRYNERVLYSFVGGMDASSPTSTLVFGKSGDLYGTSSAGGRPSCDCGTIFKVTPSSGKEIVLHRFGAERDGSYPSYGLTQDASGNFYGATVAGGHYNQGAVFEFQP